MRRRRALVLGLGRFGGGRAAAEFLHRQGFTVRIADRAGEAELAESVAALRIPEVSRELCLGREDEGLLTGVEVLVCNPAIPHQHPLLAAARARGIPITQEVELFLDAYPGRVVCVTGTNGKSTTATMLAACLLRSGIDALLGGNIGRSLLSDEADWRVDQVAVLEISSFQLERLDPARRTVDGAVFTRVTEDHVDRHGSVAAYHDAKARAAVMARAFVVTDIGDPIAMSFPHDAARTWTYGEGGDVAIDAGVLRVADQTILDATALAAPGTFQLRNAAAACAAALELGAKTHATGLALATTKPLPHRLQLLAEVRGVRIFDNAVSTQIESTLSAIDSLSGAVHWVGGGKSKDGRFAGPGAAIAARVSSAHVFGAAAEPLGQALAGGTQTTTHEDLDSALDAAFRQASPGDIILFSPAFASFDQFPNFRARAERFAAWVRNLQDARR